MRIEKISIKTLIIGILLVLALFAFFVAFIAGSYFRESALKAQAQSLSRIIKIGSDAAIRQIQKDSASFGASFQSRQSVHDAIKILRETGKTELLLAQLDDPLKNGFSNMASIDLVKLRVYDLDLKLLCESSTGIAGLPPVLPGFLQAQASGRTGVERLKALNGLWVSPAGPLHSLLLPLGGIHLSGYLEVIVNPNFSLANVSTLTQMPITIYNMDDKLVFHSVDHESVDSEMQLPVEYLLKAENGEFAYRMVGMEDVKQFNDDMSHTLTLIRAILFTTGALALMLTLWTFARFMFRPISHMMSDIQRYSTEGKLSVTPLEGNVKEFHALSNAFADMAKKIHHNIQDLELLSSQDGLTGIANRRCLDIELDREWRSSHRDKTEISLLLIDIDFFKRYNDHFGHQGGDDCLKSVASAIARVVTRPGDLVARYGGEEFAVMLPGTSEEGAVAVATKVLNAVSSLNLAHPESSVAHIVTLSIGISTLRPNNELSLFHLIGLADEALYHAKKSGRNQIQVAKAENIATASQTPSQHIY